MVSSTRSQQASDDRFRDAEPSSVALVPMLPITHRSRISARPSPRADFITHLIATAEQAPQTRRLRRAAPADAEIAYTSGQRSIPGVGIKMRQTI